MQSLKTFHFVIILAAIVITDLFGAWAVHEHGTTKDTTTLVWGIASFAIGFGVIVYAIWVVRKFDKTKLE